MKKAMILLLIIIILATTTQAQQNTIDPLLQKYISQEAQNNREYFKKELQTQLEINHKDIQAQVDDNKNIFFHELNQELRGWIFKLAIIWFSTTLLALISYRLIMMRLTRKYRHIRFRDELLG